MAFQTTFFFIFEGLFDIFVTCSRICSIKTFSSTEACVHSAAIALLPSVFASRFNSCIRKSKRLPALPLFSVTMRRTSAMCVRRRLNSSSTSDFWINSANFLLQTVVVDIADRFRQTRVHLVHMRLKQAGEQLAQRIHDFFHTGQTLQQMFAEFLPSRLRAAANSFNASSSNSCTVFAKASGSSL